MHLTKQLIPQGKTQKNIYLCHTTQLPENNYTQLHYMSSDSKRYIQGVSAGKEDVHNAIKNIDKGLFPQAFCKIVPDYLPKTRNIVYACRWSRN
jgi:hypothetical protein